MVSPITKSLTFIAGRVLEVDLFVFKELINDQQVIRVLISMSMEVLTTNPHSVIVLNYRLIGATEK